MMLCFVLFSSIVSLLTSNLSEKINLKRNQYRELEKLSFSSLDWSILKVLENTLAPLVIPQKFFHIDVDQVCLLVNLLFLV